MKVYIARALLGVWCLLYGTAAAHDNALSIDELNAMFGVDFNAVETTSQKVADGFYVLSSGYAGNIGVSIGDDGVLIVDDQMPQLYEKVKAALKTLGAESVDFALNTHWHFDHAEGNLEVAKGDAVIVSHENSRKMMGDDAIINFGSFAYKQKAFPDYARPDITFDKSMHLYFNGEQIDLIHQGAAHTNGDMVVFFRGKNIVHMGDVYNAMGYPFIDSDNGGGIVGMIAFCEMVYNQINADTVVISGHGPVSDRAKLARYIHILKEIKKTVQALIDDGADLDAVIKAKPTKAFDKEMNAAPVQIESFLSRVYASLTPTADE